MAMNYPHSIHRDSLELGLEFQDFVCMELAKQGVILQNIVSKKHQFSIGENLQGFEIKHDTKWMETGNLYIETSEKSNPDMPFYTSSGIYRCDNSWLYLIGNYQALWILAKRFLIEYHQSGRSKTVKTPTSVGYLLPIEQADKWCCKKLVF